MSAIDTLIRGGKVIDGSGNPWFCGDVALSGDRVVEVAPPGSLPSEGAREVVDAAGMVVCPGFIDRDPFVIDQVLTKAKTRRREVARSGR
jgi:N-acyl-D-amino-acid deacylase